MMFAQRTRHITYHHIKWAKIASVLCCISIMIDNDNSSSDPPSGRERAKKALKKRFRRFTKQRLEPSDAHVYTKHEYIPYRSSQDSTITTATNEDSQERNSSVIGALKKAFLRSSKHTDNTPAPAPSPPTLTESVDMKPNRKRRRMVEWLQRCFCVLPDESDGFPDMFDDDFLEGESPCSVTRNSFYSGIKFEDSVIFRCPPPLPEFEDHVTVDVFPGIPEDKAPSLHEITAPRFPDRVREAPRTPYRLYDFSKSALAQ